MAYQLLGSASSRVWPEPTIGPMLFARAILAGEPIKVFNHGKMQRDFTYIDDIVEGVIRCCDNQMLILTLIPFQGPATAQHRIGCSISATANQLSYFVSLR